MESKDTEAADPGGESEAKFFHPETGEPISKNAWKKLQKAPVVKKEKAVKIAVVEEKKEKKVKKEKEVEEVFLDQTAPGEKKNLDGIFPPTYQPKYVEAAWQSWWEKCGFYTPDVQAALAKGKSIN